MNLKRPIVGGLAALLLCALAAAEEYTPGQKLTIPELGQSGCNTFEDSKALQLVMPEDPSQWEAYEREYLKVREQLFETGRCKRLEPGETIIVQDSKSWSLVFKSLGLSTEYTVTHLLVKVEGWADQTPLWMGHKMEETADIR